MSLRKNFQKNVTESFEYDSELNKYFATEIVLDEKDDTFLLNNIEKTKDEYIVDIIEYIEDYSEGNTVKVTNLDNEVIGNMDSNESESKIQDIVKENIDRFSKKKIYLKSENNRLIIKKVEKE